MTKMRGIEAVVGLFMLTGLLALFVLAFKVSGLTRLTTPESYNVTANFDNIGSLKVRSAVTIAGVRVGEVKSIELDPVTFRAKVIFRINAQQNNIPDDTSASIYTEGLLGSNYIGLTPGFDEPPRVLKNGSMIQATNSALVLENLIGQFLFNINKKN